MNSYLYNRHTAPKPAYVVTIAIIVYKIVLQEKKNKLYRRMFI